MRELLKKTLLAAIGLICFGAGVYLTIQANIGVAPWDALNLGLSKTFGILYGTASVGVSVILILIDLLLKEHIGIGTILDAVLVGKTRKPFQCSYSRHGCAFYYCFARYGSCYGTGRSFQQLWRIRQ